MIVGLIAADHGNILLDQKNLTKTPIHMRAKQGISYLPQEPSIFRRMDVSENIISILEPVSYTHLTLPTILLV